MAQTIRIGTVGEIQFMVGEEHVITFAVDGMPKVLSTPSLLAVLEHAARQAITPMLDPGESSVGVDVQLEHLAGAPLGAKVTCRARVIHVDGKRITFQLEAHDELEPLARGVLKRQIVLTSRLARRMERKRTSN